MTLILSLSNLLTKTIKQDFPRLYDQQGNNPGVQKISTHSTQISWQFQIINLCGQQWAPCNTGDWVVMAVESYSRYTIMNVYHLKPELSQIEHDFKKSWLEHLTQTMRMGGFIRNKADLEQVTSKFNQLKAPEYYRNLDTSIGGHINDNQQWLSAYIKDTNITYFEDRNANELANHLNQLTRRINKQRRKENEFLPIERFLDDGLYRFAYGICDLRIPNTKFGNFPNPHRAAVNFKLVKQ